MHFSTLITLLFASATALAAPPMKRQGVSPICPAGLYSTPQCCATDVLGVADLDCGNPPDVPTTVEDFKGACASIGKEAACCVLPIVNSLYPPSTNPRLLIIGMHSLDKVVFVRDLTERMAVIE